MLDAAFVYILSGDSKRLYIGVTSELQVRVTQHKEHKYPDSFTARYNITRLVYYERYDDIRLAIGREKQLKRWSRIKKVGLIVSVNPDWRDLSEEWGGPAKLFDGKLRAPVTF